MWFWWYMLFCDLLTPVLMIFCGRMMWKHYPKDINSLVGYRTKRSAKNLDTWIFAHEHAGKLWWTNGWLLLIPSLLIHLLIYGATENTIEITGTVMLTLQLAVLIVSIFPTERALKRTFNEDGTRRERNTINKTP